MLAYRMAGRFHPATAAGWKSAIRPGAVAWLVVALALLIGLFWVDHTSLSHLSQEFAAADWRLALAALVLFITVDLAKAWRWQVLYGALQPTYQRVLQAQVVGQAANTLVPLRLGEVFRISWAAPTAAGVARGTAGLVLTKAIDAVVLAGLIVWVFGSSLLAQAQLLPVVVLGVVVALVLALAQRYRYIGGGGLAAIKPLTQAAARYARELSARTWIVVLATSAFAWLVGGIANLAVLAAVDAPTTVDAAGRILASGYVAGLLPAPPGRLGVFEGAVAAALAAGGMDLSRAVEVAVVMHALQLLEVGLLGIAATRWR